MAYFSHEQRADYCTMSNRNSTYDEIIAAWNRLKIDFSGNPEQFRAVLQRISEACPVSGVRAEASQMLAKGKQPASGQVEGLALAV